MNKRIRELVEQAGGNPNYKAFGGHFLPPPPDYIDPATVDLEKFAELIVKETVLEVWIQLFNHGIDLSENTLFLEAMKKTKEHFGVEE